VKRIERIVEFEQRPLDIGQRERREITEPVGPCRDDIGSVFVDAARHLASLGRRPLHDAGRGERQDSRRDLLRIHERDGGFGRPVGRDGAGWIAAMGGKRLGSERRDDMLVDINTRSMCHGLNPFD